MAHTKLLLQLTDANDLGIEVQGPGLTCAGLGRSNWVFHGSPRTVFSQR